jgi:hypothetical protein
VRIRLFVGVLGVAACGGNVVVDHGVGSAGGGGANGGSASAGNASGSDGRPSGIVDDGVPACDAPALSPSAGACFSGKGQCNPVTGAPCTSNGGQSCDLGERGLACFAIAEPASICSPCDAVRGPLCGPGLTCLQADTSMGPGLCARYCCDDGDCGSSAFCFKYAVGLHRTGIGVCIDPHK